jgi:uncharacterized membrane protein YjfL (UPF0719 family)
MARGASAREPATNLSEVGTVRSRKRPALIKASLLLELAGHGVMGVAMGLAFAFLLTHVTPSSVAALIRHSTDPAAALLRFVGTCATTFGIGAALTGLVMTLTESDSTGCK